MSLEILAYQISKTQYCASLLIMFTFYLVQTMSLPLLSWCGVFILERIPEIILDIQPWRVLAFHHWQCRKPSLTQIALVFTVLNVSVSTIPLASCQKLPLLGHQTWGLSPRECWSLLSLILSLPSSFLQITLCGCGELSGTIHENPNFK